MSVKPHVVLCFALFEEENCKKRGKTLNFLPKPLSISSSLENDKICSGEGKGGKICKRFLKESLRAQKGIQVCLNLGISICPSPMGNFPPLLHTFKRCKNMIVKNQRSNFDI